MINLVKKINKKKLLVLVLVVTSLIFFGTRGSVKPSTITTAEVKNQEIKSEVSASGKIVTDSQSSLNFPISGKLVTINVSKGDQVVKGQVLATLDNERFQIALRQIQQDLNVADAELEKVYDDVRKTEGVESFNEKIQRTTAEANKNKLFDAVKRAKRDLQDTVLVSPLTGNVTSVDANIGEEISPSNEIIKISQTKNIHFIAEVDETEIMKIKPMQKGTISFEAKPDQQIESFVKLIGFENITASTGATAYEVTFKLPDIPEYRIGMTGQVDIVIDQMSVALTIPQNAVQDGNYVWLKKGSRFEKQDIQTGLESETEIAIISGLSEGDQLVVSGFDNLNKKSLFQKIFEKIKSE